MSITLKKLSDQVIVITGASSGIGLTTAKSAAARGAKVVLAARSGNTLNDVVSQIKSAGGNAIAVPCDVADRKQVENLANEAVRAFGRIDTWVNDAGTAIYGRLDEVSDDDSRKLFDINFWGVVHGSLVALPHLKKQGGALINLGSEVSEAVAPLIGMYSASKHAVKGFTDGLRIELEQIDKGNIAITLIQPTAVDTPFDDHSKNYLANRADLPTPMIDPQQVADAILSAAEKHTRATKVGMMAKVNTFVSNNMPGIAEHMAAKQAKNMTRDGEPETDGKGILTIPSEDGRTHGDHARA